MRSRLKIGNKVYVIALLFLCRSVLPTDSPLANAPFSKDEIDWNEESLKSVHFADVPTVQFSGKIAKGSSLDLNSSRVNLDEDGKFEFALELATKENSFQLVFTDKRGDSTACTLSYRWKKPPPIINIKVKEGENTQTSVVRFVGSDPADEWLEFKWSDVKHMKAARSPEGVAWHNHLQLTSLAVLPTTGGNSISPEVRWAPIFKISENFLAQAGLGLAVVRYDATTIFAVGEAGVSISHPMGPVQFGLGPLIQHWNNYGGIRLCGSASILYPLSPKWLGIVESVVGGYNLCLPSDAKVHQASLGLGISI